MEPGAQAEKVEHAILARLDGHRQRLGQIAQGKKDGVDLITPEALGRKRVHPPAKAGKGQRQQEQATKRG